jgi:hypothetical protein
MSDSKDFFKGRVGNPEAHGQGEKELWIKIEPIVCELLDELKINNKVKTSFTHTEIEHFYSITGNLNQLSLNNILLLNLFDTDKSGSFLQATSKFGFDETKIVSLYVEIVAYSSILDTELFKTLLLFHLKDVNHQVSKFPETMENSASNAWKKLKPFVDNKFRNSLAHGTWAVENKEIVLFNDAKLEPYATLGLADFIVKMKEQNLLYNCLLCVLNDRWKAGFFNFVKS